MMNACRKWRHAKDVGNEEARKKCAHSLFKEIVYFVSHGLGLEGSCCQKEVYKSTNSFIRMLRISMSTSSISTRNILEVNHGVVVES